MAASSQKLARIPTVVAEPSMSKRLRLSPACLIRLNSLSESTGKTQGMRFRIIPPNSADNSRMNVLAKLPSSEALPTESGMFPDAFSNEPFAFPCALSSFFFKSACEPLFLLKPIVPTPNVTLDGARQMELSQA